MPGAMQNARQNETEPRQDISIDTIDTTGMFATAL
jgi:hypothetical protein